MAPANSLWIVPSLQRYRFPIIALACLAAGATIYYAQNLQSSGESTSNPGGNLHRSNARHHTRRRRSAGVPPESREQHLLEQTLATEGRTNPQAVDGEETENDDNSELSWGGQDEGSREEESKDGQSLLLLLYKIAEENSRKDGYVHRGVACDSCHENPIKGIRYRCVNCADHDLCETCESTQTHNRQHLFLKIRIPAPQLGTHKERQPVFYPGKPKAIIQDLRKEKVDKFCRETGYKSEEIEAFWEQFRSMAATEWPNDPDHYGLAIDRPTFDQCFVPNASGRPPPPNLIYNRIFSYYDTNDDELIGFAEFIKGLASLKRKNVAERMKRVFKGYDISNDGYVDRRDFLKLFRAYYAHIKELMGDIVAAAQDDDDQDARELVSSGQPISSAFNGPGPIHSGDIRQIGTGKLQNNFGDYEVVDGMGAVDEHEFNPNIELDSIISENAEAARWPAKHHPMSRPDFPKSGQAIHDFVARSSRDELESLMEYYDVHDLIRESSTEDDVQKVLRRVLHGKLAEELRRRRGERRDAIMRRTQRQPFYQHLDKASLYLDPPSEVGGISIDMRMHTQMENDLKDVQSSQLCDEFNGQLIKMIEALDWPIERVMNFKDSLYDMVRRGWSWKELARDLDGYSADPKEVEKFVRCFIELLSHVASEVRRQPDYEMDLKKVSMPDRSRSSSKVRFKESVGAIDNDDDQLKSTISHYAKSRPLNERWGAFEAPDPELDVGQEVLFTVTEEAMNELLDPVFKLREDLALRALLEKKNRAKYRADIVAAVPSHQNLRDVKLYLERYSRRWRQTKDHPPPPPHDQDDETVWFKEFVDLMVSGKTNNVNGTKCTECLKHDQVSWVRIGEYCTKTQYHSRRPTGQPEGRRLEDEKTSPAEKCPMCAEMDKESWISGLYCGQCGQPCARLIAEEAKTRHVIETGGEVPSPDPEEDTSSPISSRGRSPSPDQPSTETAEDGKVPADSSAEAGPSTEPEEPPAASTAQEGPSKPDRRPDPSKLLDEDKKTQNKPQYLRPNEPETVYTDTTSYPEMAHDLHSSVAAFNSLDPTSLEALIASKPLNDLLAESGYASAEADQPLSRDLAPDPTLPQNRPNAAPSPRISPAPQVAASSSAFENGEKRRKDDAGAPLLAGKLREDTAPSEALCKFYACLDILEAEDRERGGPGRINFEEFEEIMMGEKGAALGFLASWVEIGAF